MKSFRQPIFIHSLFRTGSTYIWNKFRQSEALHCYYEPFHQELAFLESENRDRWNSTPAVAVSIGHPLLDREYMHEYRHLLRSGQKGVPFFKKSFSFDDFCNNGSNPGQKKYINFLLENSGQRIPLLQFNRSALRTCWFKKNYPDVFHVYLLRDPRQQFGSYFQLQKKKNLDIFLLMNLLTVSVNMRKCNAFRELAHRQAFFEYHAKDFAAEEEFYRKLLPFYSCAEHYAIHYCIWFAALLENLAHADMFLNIDLLSDNSVYRSQVSRSLKDVCGVTFDFGNAQITKTGMSFLPEAEASQIESDVRTMLLKKIGKKPIRKLSDRFDSENHAMNNFNRKLWPELRKRELPAVDVRQALIDKQEKVFQKLSPQLIELQKAVKASKKPLPIIGVHTVTEVNASEYNDRQHKELQSLKCLLSIPPGKPRCPRSFPQVVRHVLKKSGLVRVLASEEETTRWHGGLRLAGLQKKSQPGLPLITVVTVVLNETETLESTIMSVLQQSYANIEFIVIDGGSTKPTLDILKKYGNKIDYWLSGPDRGIFDAMNKGIALAGGEWINFLNCNDRFYRNDTVQTVFSQDYQDADFIYGHTNFQGGDFRGVVKAWDFRILWKTMVFTHQSLFCKNAILKNRNFNIGFRICADYDLIYNSWIRGLKFHNSDKVIASFDPGFSEISRARMAWEKWLVVRKHRNDLPFHFFYLQLFFKRLFRDIIFLLKKRQKRRNES